MNLKACLALIRMQLRLAMRERSVLFFNYFFPLIFFFGFGAFLGGRAVGAAMTRVVTMVIVLGILGSGLFGAGLRAVAERETGILRRYKVAPITPVPILIASLVTGWLLYLPSALFIVLLSHFFYQMPLPSQPFSLIAIVTLGCFAFRAIGLIIASVANTAAESNVMVQILYMPMLFLSGATFPVSSMPVGAQIASQFLPASYLNSGMQHVMLRAEGIAANLGSVGALLLTTLLATFISAKLFRWEKEEKLPGRAKAWVAAVFVPFLILGGWQAYSHDHINEAKRLDRQIRRSQARLIRGATIFTGDGQVVVNGSILVRNGLIEQVFSGAAPAPESLQAEVLEAAGKTVLPGLIDVDVRLDDPSTAERALAAYLYAGVTAVGTSSELLGGAQVVNSGAKLGAEVLSRPAAGFVRNLPRAEPLPEEEFARMRREGAVYVPGLAAAEALAAAHEGRLDLLGLTLVQQVAPPGVLELTRAEYRARTGKIPNAAAEFRAAQENLRRAWKAQVALATGTGSGDLGLIHGPALHRELRLWTAAGIPAPAALMAATHHGARLMEAESRIGIIRPGWEATLLLVDGNPLTEISATERIASVLFKGELVIRGDLFDQK